MYKNRFRALPLNPSFSIANFAKMSMVLLPEVFRHHVLFRFFKRVAFDVQRKKIDRKHSLYMPGGTRRECCFYTLISNILLHHHEVQ